jgi:hypothetical protein
MLNYIEYKLKIKVNTHLSLAGLNTNVDISKLVEKVKDLGDYKIVWEKDVPIDIEMFNFPHRVNIESGKYFIFNDSGSFRQQLYSSEFIQFNLKEMREYKLNEILK